MYEHDALSALDALYCRATPEQLARGRAWYRNARRECRRMARKYGRPLSQVAAVLAITSPDAQLAANLRWTEEILQGSRTAGRYPADQAPKVAAALSSGRPGQYASGPKVSAFYRAIMGDTDALVIDRWASFAAGGPKDRVPPARMRRVIADAYRALAARHGETVADLQAIVWTVCRDDAERSNGVAVRYSDIH